MRLLWFLCFDLSILDWSKILFNLSIFLWRTLLTFANIPGVPPTILSIQFNICLNDQTYIIIGRLVLIIFNRRRGRSRDGHLKSAIRYLPLMVAVQYLLIFKSQGCGLMNDCNLDNIEIPIWQKLILLFHLQSYY